ncbi:hypothetical protein P8452_48540 [Trifolium repens]|nr:hypothetical protein P8452_48540 [Trifolium repens]
MFFLCAGAVFWCFEGIEAFVRSGFDSGGFGECFCLFSKGEAVLSHVSGDGGGFLFPARVLFWCLPEMVLFSATVMVPVASCAIDFCSYRRIPDLYVAAGWLLVVGGEGLIGYWLLQGGGQYKKNRILRRPKALATWEKPSLS